LKQEPFKEKIFRRTAHQTDRREGVRLEECSQAEGEQIGKKQEKGRAANRKAPAYSTDADQAYAIDERIKNLVAWSYTIKSFSRLRRRRIFQL